MSTWKYIAVCLLAAPIGSPRISSGQELRGPPPTEQDTVRTGGREAGREGGRETARMDEQGAAFVGSDKVLQQVMNLLIERHVDTTISQELLYQAAIDGVLRYAFEAPTGETRPIPSDTSTLILSPKRQETFSDFHKGQFVGLGLLLVPEPSSDAVEILEVMAGSPSEKAGLLPGDRILKMNEQPLSASGWPQSLVNARPDQEAPVTLTIKRNAETLTRAVQPGKVELETATGEMLPDKVGLVRLRYIVEPAPRTVQGLLLELRNQNVSGLVLDLRGCMGNNLEIAVQLLDLFIPEGKIVLRLTNREGSIEVFRSHGAKVFATPLAIMIDHESDLGAEVVARAMKLHRDATLVGSKTRGQAMVTELEQLENGYAIRVPTRQVLALEDSLERSLEMIPDIVSRTKAEEIQTAYDTPDISERTRKDPALAAAIEALQPK